MHYSDQPNEKRNPRVTRWIRTALATVFAGGLAMAPSGCGKSEAKAPSGPPPEPPPHAVVAADVVAQDIHIYLEEIGKCSAPEIVSIQPQVTGRVTAIHFKEGIEVKKGDRLFTIDPRPYQASLDQAKADLEVSKSAVTQAESMMKSYYASIEESKAKHQEDRARQSLYETEAQRAKNLLETNAIARQEFDSKQMTVDAGKAQLASSAATIAKMEAQIQMGDAAIAMAKAKVGASAAAITTAEINLEYTEILSPIDGRVGQRQTDIGNTVTANNGTTLVVIQRLDPIYADFNVPEAELPRVRASLAAGTVKTEVWVPGHDTQKRTGELSFLDSNVQDGSGTVKLRATLQNADRYFWPGQFVRVRLLLSERKGAPLVPMPATQIGQQGTFVFVIDKDMKAALRPVKLGQRHGTLVAIEEGLTPGEKVVLTGQLMLQPGQKVMIVPAPVVPGKTPPPDAKPGDAKPGETKPDSAAPAAKSEGAKSEAPKSEGKS